MGAGSPKETGSRFHSASHLQMHTGSDHADLWTDPLRVIRCGATEGDKGGE